MGSFKECNKAWSYSGRLDLKIGDYLEDAWRSCSQAWFFPTIVMLTVFSASVIASTYPDPAISISDAIKFSLAVIAIFCFIWFITESVFDEFFWYGSGAWDETLSRDWLINFYLDHKLTSLAIGCGFFAGILKICIFDNNIAIACLAMSLLYLIVMCAIVLFMLASRIIVWIATHSMGTVFYLIRRDRNHSSTQRENELSDAKVEQGYQPSRVEDTSPAEGDGPPRSADFILPNGECLHIDLGSDQKEVPSGEMGSKDNYAPTTDDEDPENACEPDDSSDGLSGDPFQKPSSPDQSGLDDDVDSSEGVQGGDFDDLDDDSPCYYELPDEDYDVCGDNCDPET